MFARSKFGVGDLTMKRFLLATAFALAFTAPGTAQQLNVEVFDNASLVGSTTSSGGSFTLDVSDPAFDVLTITGAGSPDLPGADLSTITLNVTSGAITTTHNLEIDVFQTGVSAPAGTTATTFTANALIGDPGPTTESTFAGGTTSTLGLLVDTTTFPAGTIDGSVGPDLVPWTAITSDAQQYLISFNAADQSSNDTIEFSTTVPEASTWAMLIVGFVLIGGLGWRRGSRYAI